MTIFDVVTHGKAAGTYFYGVSHIQSQDSGAPALSNFGVPFIYAHTFFSENDQVRCGITHMGKGVF